MFNSTPFTEGNMAYGRVSSTVAVSSLDWLTAVTLVPVDIDSLVELSVPDFKGAGYTTRFSGKDSKVWFKQFKDKRVLFSFNPSKDFTSGWELLNALRMDLGPWALEARVSRLDCAVTLPLSFQDVFMGLDFGSKRSVERYPENSLGRSVYVGRKGRRNEMLIYDKRKQSRTLKNESEIKYPCTRIEINSLVKKGMKVKELPQLIEHRPFRHVIRKEIVFKEPTVASVKKWRRYGEFVSLVEREGFFMTKKILAKKTTRNFLKLYGSFYELNPVRPSLDSIFKRGMAQFFQQ